MKPIAILGSTGSIGKQTLEVVREHKEKFRIVGLAANNNIELLQEQIAEFNPTAVCVMNPVKADLLREKTGVEVFSGIDGLNKISALDETDTVVNALVGSIGILPTINAIKHKKNIAIANKETLVTAGKIVMEEVRKNNVSFLPIDSEHSAILQCIKSERKEDIRRIILTCSGGPFRNFSAEQIRNATVNDALNHPTWNMGAKITVDSATLMNKGFEVIEAHWLYSVPYENVEVVVHPESIVHSFVEFNDSSTLAQMGFPDMRIPIQYSLSYPERIPNNFQSIDFGRIKSLNFEKPDLERFPCLRVAYDAGIAGGTLPAVLNASNEIAVKFFLDGKIRFFEISEIIKSAIERHKVIKNPNLDEILNVDRKTREDVQNSYHSSP